MQLGGTDVLEDINTMILMLMNNTAAAPRLDLLGRAKR